MTTRLTRWKISCYRLASLLRYQLSNSGKNFDSFPSIGEPENQEKPIVLFSSCISSDEGGDIRYNGGTKIYNQWAKLLRKNGIASYVVTYDGCYHRWLIEHQPHVSIETIRRWKEEGRPLRFVTGWVKADQFIGLADRLFFYDAEIAYTSEEHFSQLTRLLKTKIQAVATHSRIQQAWYLATFGRDANLIPIWCDEDYWFADTGRRHPGLVGYLNEGPDSRKEIAKISQYCQNQAVDVQFVEIAGSENEVLQMMRRCDVYLGLNPGKHPLWGEGCPITQLEAMHAGCVVIAYDVRGNREYLIDNYSGFLAPRGRPDLLAKRLVNIIGDPGLKEKIRSTSVDLASSAFSSRRRWELIRDFLELEEHVENDNHDVCPPISTLKSLRYLLSRDELEKYLGAPVYLGIEEIPVLAEYAGRSKNTLVEIGAAYGGSTLLFLANLGRFATLHSIDSFIPDSARGFQSSPEACRQNVLKGTKALRMPEVYERWRLHTRYSHEVAPDWNEPIDVLFIDGDHDYEAVRRDFVDWLPHMKKGAYILLHDSRMQNGASEGHFGRGWSGPTRLAEELRKNPVVELVQEVFSLTVWKVKNEKTNGASDQEVESRVQTKAG